MIRVWLFGLASMILFGLSLAVAAESSSFATTVTNSQLDRTAFAQWVDGAESPISVESAKDGPREVIWTREQGVGIRGVEFGTARTPGVRHLRVGFTESISVGAVLVRGGGRLSVLKADAAYPGDLGNDAQWIPADWLQSSSRTRTTGLAVAQKSDRPVASRDDYALWTLPPGTQTRALRFTHQADPSDQNPAGWVGGVWVLPERTTNIAPQASISSSSRNESAGMLIDESHNQHWAPWDNGERGAALPVSAEHPEFITLTWPKRVQLSGVCLLWAGIGATDVEVFNGSDKESPQTAGAGSWRRVATSDSIEPFYPRQFGPNWIAFGSTVETRALRLRITSAARSKGAHPHLVDKFKDGRRIWLGELIALTPLGQAPLSSVELSIVNSETPPPIPVRFTLPEAGVVTLVIEDAQGRRVRNLVSETPFPAGANTAWWDGSDDLLRDTDAAKHGLYHIPTRFVAPGQYVVRGMWRKPLKLSFEQSVYSAGKPAWTTDDKTGGWMTNHTPPTSIACVPGRRTRNGQPLVFMGAFVAEGGHGLQWIKEDGTKVGGQHWLGGTWTGAPTLAADLGDNAIAEHVCYAASVWEGELRITAKTADLQDKTVLKLKLGEDPPPDRLPKGVEPSKTLEGFDGGDRRYVLAGIAARDGVIVCSLIRQNELLLVDARSGQVSRKLAIANPRGVAFDVKGQLLVLSGTKLVAFSKFDAAPTSLIGSGLDDPRHVALDANGNLFISDRGHSHQVKVLSDKGQFLRAIGKAGTPSTGKFDPLHMNNPNGLGIDSQGHVWVAENDFHPKRVSLWTSKGELLKTFYGPGEYGGGGVLDSADKTRFFYKGLEFKLDWQTGRDELVRVFYRPTPLLEAHYGPYSPDTPLYPESRPGQRYFTSCFTHNPTNGDGVSFLWRDDGNVARLTAALGDAHGWSILKTDAFKTRWPQGVDPSGDRYKNPATFVWSDLNGDALPQPDEVQMLKAACSGVTTQSDLSFIVARFDGKAVRFAPTDEKSGRDAAPRYRLDQPIVLANGAQGPKSSGGDQALTDESGWTIHTVAPEPFFAYGLGGSLKGEPRWSYPSPWPGLHASHEAAVPDQLGMLVGPTRLLGGFIKPRGEGGPMFGINANMGNMYLFTADGLFVATLFHDIRLRPNWAMPTAKRGMDVSNVSLHDENFWPSLTQTKDGDVFLVDGARVSLVRINGLDSIRRIAPHSLTVTTGQLQQASEWFTQAEARRQAERGNGTLRVSMTATAPKVDGNLDDWPTTTDWAAIDRRGTKANFNSNSKPYDASAAVRVSGDRLFAAWRTNEAELLKNSGETPQALFKTGGCLDLMLGTDAQAKSDRLVPVPGDMRLLVARIKGQPRALLYRVRVPGTKQPVSFSSPWRTTTIDVVEDVSRHIEFAGNKDGHFEISIPLQVLNWRPQAGTRYRADLGVLRGDGSQTTQRVYWSNKATAITADVPSEAELTPRLWGQWELVSE